MNVPIDITTVVIPEYAEPLAIAQYTHNSKGVPASSKQLYKLIVDRLLTGVAIFVFIKKDGSYRKAIGTLNADTIPVSYQSKLKDTTKPDGTNQPFYDLEARCFKSFDRESAIALILF